MRPTAQSGDQGTCGVRLEGLEIFCYDAQQQILGKLNLRDLARAAPTSRYFHLAHLRRVTEERAALQATAVGAYGEDVFSGFVTAVQRALRGLSPCPGLQPSPDEWSPASLKASSDVLISSPGGARRAGFEEIREMISSGEPHCIIFKTPPGSREFSGVVASRQASHIRRPGPALWSIHNEGGNKLRLGVRVVKEAASVSVGLLLAACIETLQAMPAGSRRLLTTEFCVMCGSSEATGLREAADLVVAPLRSLADSVTVDYHFKAASFVDVLKVQARPLGTLDVVVLRT